MEEFENNTVASVPCPDYGILDYNAPIALPFGYCTFHDENGQVLFMAEHTSNRLVLLTNGGEVICRILKGI